MRKSLLFGIGAVVLSLLACHREERTAKCLHTRLLNSFSATDLSIQGGPISIVSASATMNEECLIQVVLRNDGAYAIARASFGLFYSRISSNGDGYSATCGCIMIWGYQEGNVWLPGKTIEISHHCDLSEIKCKDTAITLSVKGIKYAEDSD